MRLANSIFMIAIGAVFGIGLVLSCGGGSSKVDASVDSPANATCDCPKSEAPLGGRIKDVISEEFVIPAGAKHMGVGAACPGVPPAPVLSGGCTANTGNGGELQLVESAPEGFGWDCTWNNPSTVAVPVHVIVHCLMPAQ